MLSKTHKLTEALTTAIGPVLRENPDYDIIQQAMGLVLARIAQSTPMVGKEHLELEVIHEYAKQALTEFLRIEKEKAILDKGIDQFAQLFNDKPELGLAAINGGIGTETQAAAEEAQEKESWANSPIHQQIADFEATQKEAEQAKLDTLKES